jgi:subtilisin family serine protease
MTQEERYKITSNDYLDLLIEYNKNVSLLEKYPNGTLHVMNNRLAVVYVPAPAAKNIESSIRQFGYSAIPTCYGLVSEGSLDASGVTKIRNIPSFNLRGQGVLVGIVDTGIDYTNPVFLHEDGTSKIISIWDQTIESEDRYPGEAVYSSGIVYGEAAYFGTVYTAEQINQALTNNDPFSIVPSRDENGHGTMLAGIAAGSEDKASNFSGVANLNYNEVKDSLYW